MVYALCGCQAVDRLALRWRAHVSVEVADDSETLAPEADEQVRDEPVDSAGETPTEPSEWPPDRVSPDGSELTTTPDDPSI